MRPSSPPPTRDKVPEVPEVHVLIVDDHPIFRSGLRQRLEENSSEIRVVGEASNGLEGVALAGSLRPHVILMDCDMPIMNGLEATQRIKANCPEIHVLILSATADVAGVDAALKAGASRYLLKTVSASELRKAITEVAREPTNVPFVSRREIAPESSIPSANSSTLSKREIQILELAARGETNRAIGVTLNLSGRTVEVHMRNIFSKLGASSRTEAVTIAIRDQAIQLP